MLIWIHRVTETLTQQPSGFVQSMVAETIMGKQPEKVKGDKKRFEVKKVSRTTIETIPIGF